MAHFYVNGISIPRSEWMRHALFYFLHAGYDPREANEVILAAVKPEGEEAREHLMGEALEVVFS